MKIAYAFLILIFTTLAHAQGPLNKIVVFGDSLSDNGNMYEYMQHKMPKSPPYYRGRWTNGRVWVESVARSYFPVHTKEHLLNYAFGGAPILDDGENSFSLSKEIDSYLLTHQNAADENSLFIIWMGANDYLALPDNPDKTLLAVNTEITANIKRLVDAGAKNVMIINLPDLGKTPGANDLDSVDSLSYLSREHNIRLRNTVSQLEESYADVTWLFFDVNALLDEMLADPSSYGFNNTTETCSEALSNEMSSIATVTATDTAVGLVKDTLKNVLPQHHACDGYLFFDLVHPSAKAHQFMANETKDILNRAGVELR